MFLLFVRKQDDLEVEYRVMGPIQLSLVIANGGEQRGLPQNRRYGGPDHVLLVSCAI